jgi:peptidoglycan/xylan/chitin deacetylase (PgdA/CDA1 family)
MSRPRGPIRSSPLVAASVAAHGLGAAAVAWAPSQAPIVIAALLANHALLSTAGLFPRSAWLGPNVTRLPRGAGRVVALTFDDGPDPEVTPQVLDLLSAAGQRATFFCIGRRAAAAPDLVAEIRARGHDIQNHTLTHPNGFAFRGPGGMAAEVAGAQQAIAAAGGGTPRFFRAPAGIQNPFLNGVLGRAGLSLVSWTRRGFDTVATDGARVAARLIGPGLREGDILLLHDRISGEGARARCVVLDALPRVLDALARAGLRSESLDRALPDAFSRPSRTSPV